MLAQSDTVRKNNGVQLWTTEETKKNKGFSTQRDENSLLHRNFNRKKITKIIQNDKAENISEYMLKLKRVIKNLTVFEEGIIQMGCMKPVNFEPIYILAQMQARLYKIKDKIDLIPNEYREIMERNIKSTYLNIIDQCLGGPSENESLSEIVNCVGNIDKMFSKYVVNQSNSQSSHSEETILTRLTEGLLDLKRSEEQHKLKKQGIENIYNNDLSKNLQFRVNSNDRTPNKVKPIKEIFPPVCVTQVDKMLRKTFPCAEYAFASNIFGFHYLLPMKLSRWSTLNTKNIKTPDHISTHKSIMSGKGFERNKNNRNTGKNILTGKDVKQNLKNDTHGISNKKQTSNRSIKWVRDEKRAMSPYETDLQIDEETLSTIPSTNKDFEQITEEEEHLYILKLKPSREEVTRENKRNLTNSNNSENLIGYITDSTTTTLREKRNAVYRKLENFFLQTLNQPLKSSSND